MTAPLAVVVGASRGIGAACADALAAAGFGVARVARSAGDYRCDVTDAAAWEAAARRLLDERGVPEVVVHSAGAFLLKPLEETSVAEFTRQLELNLVAAFRVLRSFVPPMRAAGRGSLVLVGSVADHTGYPGNAAYAAGKFGLRGLHEVLVAELRGSGVRATLVSPGPTDTGLWDPVDPDTRPDFTPRRRMLRPGDVADAVVFAATRPPHVHLDQLRLAPV